MLKIRADQLNAFRQSMLKRYVAEVASEIKTKMCSRLPEVTDAYGEPLGNDIAEAVRAAERYGIEDSDQIYDWCVVRIVAKQPFYDMEQFVDILDHPFLAPYSKARHVILSFFAILAMQRKRQ